MASPQAAHMSTMRQPPLFFHGEHDLEHYQRKTRCQIAWILLFGLSLLHSIIKVRILIEGEYPLRRIVHEPLLG